MHSLDWLLDLKKKQTISDIKKCEYVLYFRQ